MSSGQQTVEQTAYETDPDTNRADQNRQRIYLGYYSGTSYWTQYSYPIYYRYDAPNPKYPQSNVEFTVGYSNAGYTTLGRSVTTYGNEVQKPLIRRGGDFEIRDDDKFLLNTTAAEWRGVEGEPYFLQFQISSFHPKGATQGEASDHIFKLCLHQYTSTVRRLSCTLHNKDNGGYRGVQVLDDSRGLGVTEYLPLNN